MVCVWVCSLCWEEDSFPINLHNSLISSIDFSQVRSDKHSAHPITFGIFFYLFMFLFKLLTTVIVYFFLSVCIMSIFLALILVINVFKEILGIENFFFHFYTPCHRIGKEDFTYLHML